MWIAVVLLLVGYPLYQIVARSLVEPGGSVGLGNYGLLGSEPQLLQATLNSLWIAGGTAAGALLIALPMAWILSRTDMPLRGMFRGAAVLTFSAPSFIAALGWVLLLGPNNGALNNLLMSVFGLETAPFDIFSPWGIIFVLSLFTYPLILLPVTAALDGIEPSLEQAAAGLGASRFRVLRTVTFPVIAPSVIAGTILVFVTSVVIFGPAAILGAPTNFQTIPTVLFSLLKFPPRIEAAAVVAVPIMVMIAALLYVRSKFLRGRRFTVIGGKPGRRGQIRLGWFRPVALLFCTGVLLLSLVLPFGMLALTSFRKSIGRPIGGDNWVLWDNYDKVLAQPQFLSAMGNSFLLAATATIAALAIAVMASWLRQRTTSKANSIIPAFMSAPLALPGAILGIGMIISFAGQPFGLGGTVFILFIAYTAHALPTCFQYVNAGMGQVGGEVEEASRSLGGSWLRTWRRITIPLLTPSLIAAGMLNFVILLRELEMSVFLYTGANPTLATVLFDLANDSLYQQVGALSVLVLLVNVVVTLAMLRLSRPKATG
ncbi:ABC transporter permease [Nakamurella alba]|uniref:ABC transporter permease n=1 Tax=Nakamurella alba TaxID=2665158 RepID=UPI002AC36F92|nr:iron ABC transporter permease [Nakamurella alba]